MTELILYSQQLFINPRFGKSVTVYGWDITGTWTKGDNKITKTGGSVGAIRQDDILIIGVTYRLKFTVTDRTAGNIFIMNKAGGTVHANVNSNDSFDIEFTADAEDLIFDCNSAFDGAIQNASISSLPERYNIDLTGEESIPFTFNIDDIFNLGTRKTTWTKNFNLPGTSNNHIAFGHLYRVNSEGVFDPRIKARAVLKTHGMVIFDGTLCLDSMSVFYNGNSFYQVQLVGEVFDIFSKMGESTIRDLDFSAYDHPFTCEALRYNWGAFAILGVIANDNPAVYYNGSFINICTDTNTAPQIDLMTSVSFNGATRVNLKFVSDHSFEVGDEIHIVSDNSRLSGTQIVVDIPATDSITLQMAWAQLTDISTPGSGMNVAKRVWNGVGYWYPLQDNGTYQVTLTEGDLEQGKLYYVVDYTGSDDFSNCAVDPITGLTMATPSGSTFLCDDGVSSDGAPVTPTNWAGTTKLVTHVLPEDGGVLESKERSINHWYPQDLIPHIFIYEIWTKMFELIGYEWECDIAETDIFKRLVMPVDQKFSVVDEEGQYVRLNDWLPGMKLKDFFISILNMFNLVILEDKELKNKVSVVSRNSFYDNRDVVSWELDAGKALNIKPSNVLLPKYYHLKYKDGQDFYTLDYNNEVGDIANTSGILNDVDRKYGDYYVSSGNRFSEKANKIEVSFVPTPMVGPLTQSPGGIYLDSDKTISVCYAADEEGNNLTRPTSYRILIAGYRGTDEAWSISARRSGAVSMEYDFTNAEGGRVFPYAAHIDSVFDGDAPYHDLNFGPLLGQYFPHSYDATTWADNCVAGRYWGRHLAAILDKNAKHISGDFKLSINDIYKLDFRNPVKAPGTDFVLKLQKVSDWDINGNGICKCEFLLK